MKQDQQCHVCGQLFYDSQMADWTICFACKKHQMEELLGEDVYIDSLGITWTKEELENAGGIAEVQQMAHDADARNYFNTND